MVGWRLGLRPLSPNREPGSAARPRRATARAPAAAPSVASFEDALRELEQVVERLELGSLGLEEAVGLFERGSELAARCQAILDAAELRVSRLAAETATPLSETPAPGE